VALPEGDGWEVRQMNDGLSALLTDEEFGNLLNETARRCIPWEEFLSLPQPRGMSPLDTWGLLREISRLEAVPLNVPDLDGNVYWYRRTYELDDAVAAIRCECRQHSALDRVMAAGFGQQFVMASRIAETIGTAQLDGLAISEEDSRVLLRMDRTPRTDAERLLVNTFAAFDVLPSLVDEPFSLALFARLRDMLLEGVDTDSLSHARPKIGLLQGVADPDHEQQAVLAYANGIAAYLNRETVDRDDVSVLQGQVMIDAFRYARPFGIVSSQVGRLAAGLFALKNGLPVLSLLPVSRARVDWEMGRIAPPAVSFGPEEMEALRRRHPFDATPSQTLLAQLILFTLKNVTSRIDEWERRDDEMRGFLRSDPMLNHRQRSILARALRSPDAEFRIRYHQTNHNIHYATARRDLFELQAKGYLSVAKQGKTYIFTRGPRITELELQSAARVALDFESSGAV